MRPRQAGPILATALATLATLAAGAPGSAAGDVPVQGAPTARVAWIAHLVIRTPAFSAPASGRVRTTIAASASPNGGPVALLVLDARALPNGAVWVKVLLPRRPNGAAAWIDSNYVELTRTRWRIDISTGQRSVTLLRAGRPVDRWRAVVGKPSTPTPRGLFAVYQRVPQPSPDDFLGTWALLLTGFSNALHAFDGGPGQVAIHGRGGASLLDPLGSARSHGCIRVDNSVVDLLAATVPDGTPVQIS
jgi:lipoprotein-anchoring transpeptidase ErfK/SrfK